MPSFPPDAALRPAIFFDRDGVLNHDYGYVHTPEDFVWMPEAKEAVLSCNRAGWLAFVVTNQGGVARGYYTEQSVVDLHAHMQSELAAVGAHIDAFAFCPHHPEGIVPEFSRECDCRKPAPGMLLRLCAQWPVRREASFLIGDRPSDVQAALAAGIRGVLYEGGSLLATIAPLLPLCRRR